MNEEYYQLTAELDAREVLRYLNNLGIHNISGEVLKYFITDLKKLIKYDLQQKYNKSNEENVHIQGPERLHSASTFSSRVRSRASEGTELKCSRDCQTRRRNLHVRNTHSAPNIRQELPEEKPLRRACSCIRVEKKDSTTNQPKVTTTTTTLSKNFIKVPRQPVMKKCDPVTLYHYYTSLWEKYKSNVPGENNWSDLRWSVRQKMAGCKDAQTKVSEAPTQQKTVDK
ncbi:hypothetical protein MSG28_006301 [Choristoneura fumiferana]|uniref:Uncharacterized protein n=2 Tax=Choristoneura fumiferana TaxID=7141 RepID=A0ACC0JEA8_CHOFU|nr:hypothetical protein MSG28_006300 [Choristoneura fumiferana]KAI8422482.1 hypothetical protein MSG28_006301 [Choristoneura fumiferana]